MNAQLSSALSVADALRAASSIIPPVWPLDRFVAVNPYLGLQQRRFEESAGYLEQVCGVRSTLPLGAYAALIERGELSLAELDEVLEGSGGTL
ncbi:MAG: putative inorganic carbon transporter subunit DabA, partial [Polyangiaceae bacterium]